MHYLLELLHGLRGREVRLLVGRVQVAGRLLSVDPLLVVDLSGRATLVRLERIRSVEF